MMNIELVTLEGQYVRLEPLDRSHEEQLRDVALDDDLWRWTITAVRTADDLHHYVEDALAARDQGTALPFATIDRLSGRAIGSTRFYSIDRPNRGLEIGWTWVGRQWQRTPINTEAKYLMLRHAFEVWKCIRVEFKTHIRNEKSRNALLRIGAKQEGILRNQRIMPDGSFRDSVCFSIIDSEWQTVKTHLEEKLARPYTT